MEEEDYYEEGGGLYVVQADPSLYNPDSAAQAQIDANQTVEYYKTKLDSLIRLDTRLRNRLKKFHHLQHQLALLVNKNLEGKYGALHSSNQDQTSTSGFSGSPAKSYVIPPLPPIQKGALSDLLRILHNVSPNELKKYLEKSGILEQLVFGDSSVFNSQLLGSVMRTPPDIQISFVEAIVDQLRSCSNFYHKFVPMLSHFVLEGYLRNQLMNPNAKFSQFFEFYENVALRSVSEICGSEKCHFLFSTNEGQSLIFPCESFSYIISVEDSLSGVLLREFRPVRINSPQQEKSFEIITEGNLFEENRPILSVPVSVGQRSAAGLAIFLKKTSFTLKDEVLSAKVVEYLTPIFSLFRSIFLHVAPSHFTQLAHAISALRSSEGDDILDGRIENNESQYENNFRRENENKNNDYNVNEMIKKENMNRMRKDRDERRKRRTLFDNIKEQACSITSAAFCKLFTCGAALDFPEIKLLPSGEPSLVRRSFEMMTSFAYKNPRTRSDFNKEVDDETSLSKISSMLVVPVKNTPLMIVLYNATMSTEFTPIQKSLANLLTVSLPPLLLQHSMKHQMSRIKKQQEIKMRSLQTSIDSLQPLIRALDSSSSQAMFFETMHYYLPKGMKINLYYFLSQIQALKLPQHEIIQATQMLQEVDEVTIIKEGNIQNIEIEANGDTNVKAIFVVPSFSDIKTVCTFSSTDANIFDDDPSEFYQKYARNLLLLLPSYVTRYQFREIQKRHQNIKKTIQLDLNALSKFVGTDIECQYFDPPLNSSSSNSISNGSGKKKALSIMVETSKGVEASLSSDVPIRTELTKNAFISYAEYMSAVLSNKIPIVEPPQQAICVSFFFDNGILDVFECTIFKFAEWMNQVYSLCAANNVDYMKSFENARFINKLFEAKKWENWFSKEEKMVINLIIFLKEVIKFWRCQADDDLLELTAEMCSKPSSGLFLSIVFGANFGIGDKLNPLKKKCLIQAFDEFAISDSASDLSIISTRVRLISLQGFKQSLDNKRWLARSLIVISQMQEYANLSASSSAAGESEKTSSEKVNNEKVSLLENKTKEMNEMQRKTAIFRIERVFLPMITYLGQRNEQMMQMLNNIRNALKILHSVPKS